MKKWLCKLIAVTMPLALLIVSLSSCCSEAKKLEEFGNGSSETGDDVINFGPSPNDG